MMKNIFGNPVLGFLSMFTLLVAVADRADALPIHNPGFETSETIVEGSSDSFDVWWGDKSEIVGTENGITPYEGSNRMLHFIYSRPTEPGSSVGSDVRQLIDVSSYDALIDSGQAVVSASAWFNRVLGDLQTDTLFQVRLEAFSGDPTGSNDKLAEKDGEIFADGDVSTWEQATLSLVLPSDTTYVRLRISSREDVFNDDSGTEFDGHYADNVYVGIDPPPQPTPEPGTLLLLGSGLAGFVLFRRRKKAA